MPHTNNYLLSVLEKNIQRLKEETEPYHHIKLYRPCFDPFLFKEAVSKVGYSYYLDQINNNHQKLITLIDKNNDEVYLNQISYLAELIINQIEALQKEIANINLKNKSTVKESDSESETLYETYNKHLGYLRRLELMKYELEESHSANHTNQQKLATLNQRIASCKAAINKLELQIEST